MKAAFVGLALAALVAGCRKAGPLAFSCWMATVCEDYAADLPTHEKTCKAMRAEWEQRACPSENLIGTCATDKGQVRKYYGGANAYTSDSASASCEDDFHGAWTSAP